MTTRRPLAMMAVLVLALLSACAAPSAPHALRASPLFELHDNSWVNLHHVLYAKGLAQRGEPTRGGGGKELGSDGLEDVTTAALSPDERSAWEAAVAHYAEDVSKRDLTFDDSLPALNDALSARAEDSALDAKAVLDRAMPIYRAHWWTQHRRANEAFSASLQPLVERYGIELSHDLARFYRVPWPAEPFRVDISMYASWSGAYSTLGPTHLTVSSVDARNVGPLGLEITFHEASHALMRPLRDALGKELATQGKSARDLWHAILFFTTGDCVRRRIAGYVPYAIEFGLYEGIPSWRVYRAVIESQWVPYLEGRKSFDSAVHDVVAAL